MNSRRLLLVLAVLVALGSYFVFWETAPVAVLPPSTPSPTVPASVVPGSAPAVLPRVEPPARTGIDASNFYKDAFVLFDRLTDDDRLHLSQPPGSLDPAAAAALFEKLKPILALLRQAAAADYCDWGMGPVDFSSPMPQLSKSRDLSRVVQWAAPYLFPTDPTESLRMLDDRAILGHHLADTLIGLLVQTSFETASVRVIADHTAAIPRDLLPLAQHFVDASTLDADSSRALTGEAAGSIAFVEKLIALSREERLRRASEFGIPLTDTQAAAFLADDTALQAEITFLQRVQGEFTDAIAWPEDRYRAWSTGIATEGIAHPLSAAILPVYDNIRVTLGAARTQRGLLGTGLSLLTLTHPTRSTPPLPEWVAPFAYAPTTGGFTLRAPALVKGKPVLMTFAWPAAPPAP